MDEAMVEILSSFEFMMCLMPLPGTSAKKRKSQSSSSSSDSSRPRKSKKKKNSKGDKTMNDLKSELGRLRSELANVRNAGGAGSK